MEVWHPAEILSTGMVTPVGLTARATAAAVRAGIVRVKLLELPGTRREFFQGFLDEEHLPPLVDVLASCSSSVSAHHQRLLRLTSGALQEAATGVARPLPLLLALPERRPGLGEPPGPHFLELLRIQSGVPFDLQNSRLFPLGRAGGLVALAHAMRLLATGRVRGVLVGGVDTYMNQDLLRVMDGEGRLLTPGLSDGFIPGEGAALLQLSLPGEGKRRGHTPLARITSVGLGHEEGHRYSDKPYRGEGLSLAFRELFRNGYGRSNPVRCVYAGLNGENFWAKEWGVAYLRHSRNFAEPLRIEHPSECTGDPGAALGPLMVALAAVGLRKGYREGPCLVWCSSDREERAAVLVESTPT
jgi:3-oxoacyl-[acyl-carrier-protein] synthase I